MDNDFVFDVTTAEFTERVIERSKQVPVVVDFWAAWCGPCRALGPVLEQATKDLGGRVLLAKVDTDREPDLGRRYEIRGIPAVKVFRDGQVVDEFVGAQGARFVKDFLERAAPSEEQRALARAAALLKGGDAAAAEKELQPLLGASTSSAVPLLLAEALLHLGGDRLGEAAALLAQVEARSHEIERAEQLEGLVAFLDQPLSEEEARQRLSIDAQDQEARFALAAAIGRDRRFGEALAELLEIVRKDRRFRDDGARRAMLTIFTFLGPEHELVQEHRRRLQLLL